MTQSATAEPSFPPAQSLLRDATLLIGLCLASLLPFLNKPLHIDDPMYVWAAQHIRQHPFDPYGFVVNWSGFAMPMAGEMQNPPAVCYYLAAWSMIGGWSERSLHAAMLLPAIGAVLGTYVLARQLGGRALLAAVALLFCPGFFLSATTIMCDVTMLCAYVWAIILWVRGLHRNSLGLMFGAALLASVSAMTKYFGFSVVPLLAACAVLRRRETSNRLPETAAPGAARWFLPLALPVLVLLAYQSWTRRLYGHGLFSDAAAYAADTLNFAGQSVALHAITAISFIGGGCLTLALVLAASARRARTALPWLGALAVVALALLAINPYPQRMALLYCLQLGLFVIAGLAIVAAAIAQARLNRDSSHWLLLLWIFGTCVFAAVFNWSVNGRAVLPAAPALAIVIARVPRAVNSRRWPFVVALALGAILSYTLARADQIHARAARRAAVGIHDRFANKTRRMWFVGHWGFQHYFQPLGGRPIDLFDPDWQISDLLIQPLNNSYQDLFDFEAPTLPVIFRANVAMVPYVALMAQSMHAGFYSDYWGPLPYAFGPAPPDVYLVHEIRAPLRSKLHAPPFDSAPPGGEK